MNGLSSDHDRWHADHRRGADRQELGRLKDQVGASELAREVGAPVALLDDAVEAR